MRPETTRRIDRYWANVFGIANGSADGGIVVAHRDGLTDYPGVFGVIRHGGVLVSVPPALVDQVGQEKPNVEFAMDPDWWRLRLPGWSVIGPSIHAFVDCVDRLGGEITRDVRTAGPADLAHLRGEVSEDDWCESGFDGDDVARSWAAVDENDICVAAANLTPFDGQPADIGVLTAPNHRGNGHAASASIVAARHAVLGVGIARWRTRVANTASRRLAERLGFEVDCFQIAVRPPA